MHWVVRLKPLCSRGLLALKALMLIALLACVGCSPGNLNHKDSRARYRYIVSGPDDYWRPASVQTHAAIAQSQAAPSTVVVDTGQRFQVWRGTGGTFNEVGWRAMHALDEGDRKKIMALLFDAQQGIGFTWGRIPIGASDFALNRYTLNDTAGDASMTQFSIARDQQYLIPFIKAAQRASNNVRFWASPWTPPPWMKDNTGFDKGAFNPAYFQAYARYLVKWVQAYENLGMPIHHLQPQNEPGWSQDYPSCAWGPSNDGDKVTQRPVTLATFVKDYLSPAIAQASLNTELWYGTLSNAQHFRTYWNALLADNAVKSVAGVGLQWGTGQFVQEIANTRGLNGQNLIVMQSEHKCGNYPWLNKKTRDLKQANQETFLVTMAPNNHAYAEESWQLIKQWVEQGVNIYSAWNMVLDTEGFNMDTVRPWPQNALIVVDTAHRHFRLTPAYYVFRHFGQYLKVGAQRVAVRGANALAFENPDGSLLVTLYNPEHAEAVLGVQLGQEVVNLKLPARGWGTLVKGG